MIFLYFSIIQPRNQTEISRSATKKKSSKSGDAKNAIGVLFNGLESTLGFFGAGGHVEISGIWNLWAFGVEQSLVESSDTSKSMFEDSLMELIVEHLVDISWFLTFLCCLLKWALLDFLLNLLLVAAVVPEGAIWDKDGTGSGDWWWIQFDKKV